jgi:anti-sigma regulatory factor (Ser/Thr protein kinase)
MTSVWIRNNPASAAAVRHFLHDEVEKAGLGQDLADDAALLASELVGNSIRHARALPAGYLNVTWLIDDAGVRVQVTDGGGGKRPQVRQVSLADTTGRGLAIVAALSDDWGVEEERASTTVWAHLPRPVPLSS